MRDGALLQDLDASDEEIRRWLTLLGDPAHWRDEAAAGRKLFEGKRAELDSKERALLDLLDATVEGAAPPVHIAATDDVLTSGYLDQQPALP